MKLQTQIPIKKSASLWGYESKLVLLGSCFAENIGEKFDYFKFRQLRNPFGILFHALAIENIVQRSLSQTLFTENDVFERQGRWYCFEVHSSVSATSKEQLLTQLNALLETAYNALNTASKFIVTLGTAWAYRHKATGKFVANCHKVPQKEFSKELLSITHIEGSLRNLVSLVRAHSVKAQFIFTVSPVRHLKDGFVENQRSKAHLIAAVHNVIAKQNQDLSAKPEPQHISYFPSYEIMIDELRDYRFYKRDMLHPNTLAIDYIWEKFVGCYILETARKTMAQIDDVQKALQHQPFYPDSKQHQQFLKSLNIKIERLRQQHNFFTF